jgi:DNA-binding transcriptional ArsR family regulator
VRAARVIDDIETLKVMAAPARAAILESLADPRSVTELAEKLGVPRTRLYHHIQLLVDHGLIEQVDERRVGALTERVYRVTAKTFRASARLLRGGDVNERVEALTTLVLDATKSDLKRSLLEALDQGDEARRTAGRSIAFLTEEQAARFSAEVERLVAAFDAEHANREGARPYALVWALYPSSGAIG